MKKVLFISYLYPPIANSGTQRSVKFANNLPLFGWTPIVLTGKDPAGKYSDYALFDEVRPDTQIRRVPLLSQVISVQVARLLSFLFDKEKVSQGVEWRIRNLWTLPDEVALWRSVAVRRAIEIHNSDGFDVIYATGYPWTSFLIARDISRKTGVPYVLDYRDLWAAINEGWEKRRKFLGWYEDRLQRSVLEHASGIISVTQSCCDYLETNYTYVPCNKVTCITNGFDSSEVDNVITTKLSLKNKRLNIVYAGVFRPGYNISELLDALLLLKNEIPFLDEKVKVTLAGFETGNYDYGELVSMVDELGQLSHQEALSLMKSADLLYLPVPVGLYSKISLPGKLFEYVGCGIPILACVPLVSEVAKVVNEVGYGVCVEKGNVKALSLELKKIILHGTSHFKGRDMPAVEKYERRTQAKALAQVLNDAVNSHQSTMSSSIGSES